jgi:hypothetical protein
VSVFGFLLSAFDVLPVMDMLLFILAWKIVGADLWLQHTPGGIARVSARLRLSNRQTTKLKALLAWPAQAPSPKHSYLALAPPVSVRLRRVR